VSRGRIIERMAETAQGPSITELEEANEQLRAELAAANAKIAEVKGRENALISDYKGLRSGYGILESGLEALKKKK
jgi:hypothetical protein